MRHEAVAGYGKEVMSDGVRSLLTPPPLDGLGRGVVELPLLVPGGEAAALEAAANERGLTAAQLARLERCWVVLDVGWPDHHPAISRWLNEGGSGRPPER
jgi:hypothetical protein